MRITAYDVDSDGDQGTEGERAYLRGGRLWKKGTCSLIVQSKFLGYEATMNIQ